MAGRESIMAARRLLNGRYQTERLLGSGGMAAIWRGRDLRLDRPVAIKELSGDGLSQPMALERFDREARAVGRLSHPNIVSVYDFGTEDGKPYLVMELVEGPTVAKLLDDGPLPVVDALAIVSQTCDGLTAAHAAGIIHRDIKPHNLILTPTGMVKICDFGVARLLDTAGQANLTGTATALGSPMYMAPEQINGDPVDQRTDLYALGCTMYAMLVGHPPFSAGGALTVVHQHLTKPPEPLRGQRPELPSEVETLVADLLAKRPDARPPDAAAVRARIAAVVADPAVDAAPSIVLRSAIPAAVPSAAGHVDEPDADEPGAAAVLSPGKAAAMSAIPPAGKPPSSPTGGSPATRRRAWVAAAIVVAALAVAAMVILALPIFRSGPQGAAEPTTASSAVTATGLSPSAIPSRSVAPSRSAVRSAAAPTTGAAASPTQTAPPSPTDPIVGLRQTIQQQVDAGNLNADTASGLNHMVDDLAKSITTGNVGDQVKKLTALKVKLTGLYNEGKLSAEGYGVLNSAVDQVAAKLG